MTIAERIAQHERIVLQFSGGKDSLAALYLLKPFWDKTAVVWCNAGDEFPETHEVIERVRHQVPCFYEVRPAVLQPESVRLHGFPSDVVPVKNERYRPMWTGVPLPGGVKIQDWLPCCTRLLFEPLQRFVREYEATLVIRGQRADEPMVGPVQDGMVVDGVEYMLPLEDWTEPQVFDFLYGAGVPIPESYERVAHSLDCVSCTAFLDQSLDKMEYLRDVYPEAWRVVHDRLRMINKAVTAETKLLGAALDLAAPSTEL